MVARLLVLLFSSCGLLFSQEVKKENVLVFKDPDFSYYIIWRDMSSHARVALHRTGREGVYAFYQAEVSLDHTGKYVFMGIGSVVWGNGAGEYSPDLIRYWPESNEVRCIDVDGVETKLTFVPEEDYFKIDNGRIFRLKNGFSNRFVVEDP